MLKFLVSSDSHKIKFPNNIFCVNLWNLIYYAYIYSLLEKFKRGKKRQQEKISNFLLTDEYFNCIYKSNTYHLQMIYHFNDYHVSERS